MGDEKRMTAMSDRRAHPRGGRRASDGLRPWYMRRPVWLAAASMLFVGWKRVRRMV